MSQLRKPLRQGSRLQQDVLRTSFLSSHDGVLNGNSRAVARIRASFVARSFRVTSTLRTLVRPLFPMLGKILMHGQARMPRSRKRARRVHSGIDNPANESSSKYVSLPLCLYLPISTAPPVSPSLLLPLHLFIRFLSSRSPSPPARSLSHALPLNRSLFSLSPSRLPPPRSFSFLLLEQS